MNATNSMIAQSKLNYKIMGLVSIDFCLSAETIPCALNELRQIGIYRDVVDVMNALRANQAHFGSVTRECVVPGHVTADWYFDRLQDDIQDATGLNGRALWAAWAKVKGNLRLRWAAKNYKRPTMAIIKKWIA